MGTYRCYLPRYGYRYYTQYTSILSGDTYIKHLSVLPYSLQIQRYEQILHEEILNCNAVFSGIERARMGKRLSQQMDEAPSTMFRL